MWIGDELKQNEPVITELGRTGQLDDEIGQQLKTKPSSVTEFRDRDLRRPDDEIVDSQLVGSDPDHQPDPDRDN